MKQKSKLLQKHVMGQKYKQKQSKYINYLLVKCSEWEGDRCNSENAWCGVSEGG